MGLFNRGAPTPPGQRGNPYAGLRNQALSLDARKIGVAPSPRHPQVIAGLMEMGMNNAVVTLAVFADGTTSMYFSTGGGILGAGQNEPVKPYSRAFLAILERHLPEMADDDPQHPVPATDMIHFRVRTDGGRILVVAAPKQDFATRRHPLSDAFYAGQDVITAIRRLPSVQKGLAS